MEGQCQADHIEPRANVGRGTRDLDHEGRHDSVCSKCQGPNTQNVQVLPDSLVCDSECLGTKKLADVGKLSGDFSRELRIWIDF